MKFALYNVTTTIKQGGVETRNREMARALARRGHQVHVLAGRTEAALPEIPGVEILTFPYLQTKHIPNLGTRFRKLAQRLSFAAFSYRTLARGGYDYIYLVKPFDIPAALASARKSGAKVIFASGGTEWFPGYRSLTGRLDYFFACSAFNARQIEEYCGLKPVVLHNGVNVDLFQPRPAEEELRRSLGLEPGDEVIMSACRLVGWKGIASAVEAAAALIKKGRPLRYLVFGDGPERPALEAQAQALGLGGRVIFMGAAPNTELPRYYALADLAVFPPIDHEAFGIALGEALACGIPVVATKMGGIPEVVVPGTGLLVPPRDAAALAEAIETLLVDSDRRRDFGRQGREWIEGHLSWDAVAARLENLVAADRS